MAAQLGYLLTAGAMPAVPLGIIPSHTAERSVWPTELFHVYDDTLVSVELLSAQVNVTQPSEIALHLKAFEQMRSMAVYGADARALIVVQRVVAALEPRREMAVDSQVRALVSHCSMRLGVSAGRRWPSSRRPLRSRGA